MRIKSFTLICALILSSSAVLADSLVGSSATYEEINGMVVIEAESAALQGDWIYESKNPKDFTGEGFVKSGENGILSYSIKINQPGVYRLIARTTRTNEIGDRGNDSYILFEGPDVRAYGFGNWYDEITDGGGMEGITKDVKLYDLYTENGWWKMSTHTNDDEWSWQATNASEAQGLWKFFHFDIEKPGLYTLKLKQRSSGHKIDRFHIFSEEVDWATTAQDISLSPTIVKSE